MAATAAPRSALCSAGRNRGRDAVADDLEFEIETLRREHEELVLRCDVLEGFVMSAIACLASNDRLDILRAIATDCFRDAMAADDGLLAAQISKLIDMLDAYLLPQKG